MANMSTTFECVNCGITGDAEMATDSLCVDCVFHCDGCNQIVDLDETYFADDRSGSYCMDCVEECGDCGEWFYWGVSDHLRYCSECEREFCPNADSWAYCDYCDDYLCENCTCSSGRPGAVNSYGYAPRLNFYGDADAPKFGVEIEFDGNTNGIVEVVHRYDDDESHVWMCDDGSLNGGAEIISHPMSLEFIQSFPFGDMVRDMRTSGAMVGNETGIHVHIGRDAFRKNGRHSAAHLARFIKFIYSNESQVEFIARRSSERWAPFTGMGKRGYMGYNETLRNKANAYGTSDVRYCAVNTTNRNTVEIRVFKSTFTARNFYAAVELVAAAVEWTRTRTADIQTSMSWDAFMAWAAADGRYPSLVAYCVPSAT